MKSSKDDATQAYLDFTRSLSYGDYLHLDELLSAHQPVTTAHDEHLFISIHHVSEIWLSLIIRELQAAMALLKQNETHAPMKMLTRVVRAQEQLTNAWQVLKTMTPSDYLQFRSAFGRASGFQSAQYRMVEILLGNRDLILLRPHQHRPDLHEPLWQAIHQPSIYDLALQILHQHDLPIPQSILERDYTTCPEANEQVLQSWLEIYHQPQRYWELYELAEKLIDVEDNFRRWRFNHLTTVERTIGFKQGSGGTSGAGYLKKALDTVLFPELWQVRTHLDH